MNTYSLVQKAIYDWVILALGSISCVWEDQDVKESEISFPYISLKLANLNQIGRDYKSRADVYGVAKITGNRESLLLVNCFGSKKAAIIKTITDNAGTYTSGSIKVIVNGTTVTQTYSTDKNSTLTLLAAAIANLSSVKTCVYSSSLHTITITPEYGTVLEVSLDLALVVGTMTMTVATSGQISPTEILSMLVASLSIESVRLANSVANVVIIENDPVKDISAILDDKSERRAQVAFIVRWANEIVDSTVGIIESVEIIESVRITRNSTNHDKDLVIDSTP